LVVEFVDLHQAKSNMGGQPSKPIRLIIRILLLEYLHNLSNEQVLHGLDGEYLMVKLLLFDKKPEI